MEQALAVGFALDFATMNSGEIWWLIFAILMAGLFALVWIGVKR